MIHKRSDYAPADIPQDPGVYVYRDQFSEVIYVGKAKSLRRRLSNYFQPSRLKSADPKLRSLINSIAFYELFPVRTESEALLLESRFIKEYAPRYNILLRDDKRFLLIKIDLDEPFPRLQLTRLRKNDGATYFGPFPKSSELRPTITSATPSITPAVNASTNTINSPKPPSPLPPRPQWNASLSPTNTGSFSACNATANTP